MAKNKQLISIIIPCFNESENIDSFYKALKLATTSSNYAFEFIYVNDGSRDDTLTKLRQLAKKDARIRILNLSRNFGKEIATTAGIHNAHGEALVMVDADGQHPPELIPTFLQHWEGGAQVVVGVREKNQKEGLVKRYGSKLFYFLFNQFTGSELIPGSTDYRLIDRTVQNEFIRLTERNRITRGLIDWLGFKHKYVTFTANPRMAGEASYSFSKLLSLALNSFISLSLKPLYFSLYAGMAILPLSVLLALFCIIETAAGDPWSLNITGTAYLTILVLFLVGIVLMSQGIIALYLSHIHTETQNRPLFILDKTNSHGIEVQEL